MVDTSVWVDHLRRVDAQLAALLDRSAVFMHPFVLGEIACGSLADRSLILDLLHELPTVVVADNDEALGFIERHVLHGRGIGYVDVHLLASVALSHEARLWTRDKRLHNVADELGLEFSGPRRSLTVSARTLSVSALQTTRRYFG